jgi:hypothetical protein
MSHYSHTVAHLCCSVRTMQDAGDDEHYIVTAMIDDAWVHPGKFNHALFFLFFSFFSFSLFFVTRRTLLVTAMIDDAWVHPGKFNRCQTVYCFTVSYCCLCLLFYGDDEHYIVTAMIDDA